MITVRLTIKEWNALHSTAVGEIESLTEADNKSGVFDDLRDAVKAMEEARRHDA